MTQLSDSGIDPVFVGIAKAIYGDVDAREILAKFSPGGSDLHMDSALSPEARAKREKKVAQVGLASTGVATLGGLHALSATRKENLHNLASKPGGEKAAAKLKALNEKAEAKQVKRVARVQNMKGPAGKVLRTVAAHPRQAAIAAGAGWAGLHGVELTADTLNARAQIKEIKRSNGQIKKAFSLKLINPPPKMPSLRARKPKANPLPKTPTAQGALFKPVTKAASVNGSAFNSNVGNAGNLAGAKAYVGRHRPTLKPIAEVGTTPPPTLKPAASAPKPKVHFSHGKKAILIATGGVAAGVGTRIATHRPRDEVDKAWYSGTNPKATAMRDARQAGYNTAAAAAHASAAGKNVSEASAKLKALKPSTAKVILGTGAVLAGGAGISALGGGVGRKVGEFGAVTPGKKKKPAPRVRRRPTPAATVEKGWLKGARSTFRATEHATSHANEMSREAAEAAKKLNDLVPDKATARKVLRRVAIGGAATIGGSSAIGSYSATRGNRSSQPKYVTVKKSTAMMAANYLATQPIWRVRGMATNAVRSKKVARGAAKAPGAIRAAAEGAEENLKIGAEGTKKFNEGIPSKKKIHRGLRTATGITLATGGTVAGGAAYTANRRGGEKIIVVPAKKPPKSTVEKSVTWVGEIAKVDADKQQVFGWASVSAIGGKPVIDLQGDIVPIEEVEKSAYRYVVESRKGGDMHRRVAKAADAPLHTADLIESFVVTGEKLEKMGLPADSLPHGWWVGFHVNDAEQWSKVKSGERAGFSIHGAGVRTPVDKSFSDVKDKATEKIRSAKKSLATRTSQALHPPKVRLKAVDSSAVKEMGYQPQTRRLAYKLHSSPGTEYTYKVPVGQGVNAVSAESKGRYYATKVARKAKRSDSVSPAGRVRLFVHPDVSKARGGSLV